MVAVAVVVILDQIRDGEGRRDEQARVRPRGADPIGGLLLIGLAGPAVWRRLVATVR